MKIKNVFHGAGRQKNGIGHLISGCRLRSATFKRIYVAEVSGERGLVIFFSGI